MREELDAVLGVLEVSLLTGAEWAKAAAVLDGEDTDKACYQALYAVLSGRSTCEGDLQALHAYYKAKGLSVDDLPHRSGKSNIFIGAPLG